MCENVIIHRTDGKEIVCEDQSDLNIYMRRGLWHYPPPTPAERWDYFCGDGPRWGWLSANCHLLPREYPDPTVSIYPFAFIPTLTPPLHFHDPLGDLEYGYQPFHCLCSVDLEETASQNGYRCSKKDSNGEFDPFDTHFYLGADDNHG